MKHNKLCNVEDFATPELRGLVREIFADEALRHGEAFPAGREWRKQWEVSMAVRALAAGGALRPDARLLGVGAGIEVTSFHLAREAREVIATDLYLTPGVWQADTPAAMLYAPARFAPFDYPRRRLRALPMDGTRLAFADESFDGVFSSSSIEHFGTFDDVAQAASEMGRVLRPGGVLSLSTEFELAGPPDWARWPHLLLFRQPDLLHYIVEASGLELLDEPDLTVSPASMEGWWPLAAFSSEVSPGEGSRGPRGGWSRYPHVVLWHEGRFFTSVHLALRKTAGYAARRRSWAAPPRCRRAARDDRDAPGLNLIGDLVVDSGLGEATRGIARAALRAGIGITDVPLRYHWWRKLPQLDAELASLPTAPRRQANLLFFGLTQLEVARERVAAAIAGRPTIAYWMWELPHVPPAIRDALPRVEEVWTCSRHVRSLLAPHVPCPIRIVPLVVDPRPTGADARARHGFPRDRFVFLASLSVASLLDRKNPLGVIAAFRRAFGDAPAGDGAGRPLLVLKLQHSRMTPSSLLREAALAAGALVIDEDLDRGEMDDLLAACDAYVSLHRAEGFGLGMAEAMALGKPVIATAFSGNMDFMRAANSFLVPFRLELPAAEDRHPEALFPYGTDIPRAAPDLDAAARWMRQLVATPEEGRRRGARAAADVRRLCSPEAVARRVAHLFASFSHHHLGTPPGDAMHDQLARNLIDQREELDDVSVRLAQLLEQPPQAPSADLLALANHIGIAVGEDAPAPPPRFGRWNLPARLRRVRHHVRMLRHALLKQVEFDRALLRELGRE